MAHQPENLSLGVQDHPTPSLTWQLTAHIAEILDKAGIPNALWGFQALYLYGVDKTSQDIDFLVPDDQVQTAASSLVSAGFLSCESPDCTVEVKVSAKFAPSGHVHIHNVPDESVCLYKHSEYVWRVPCLNPSETGPDQDIMYASDDCLPRPVPLDLHPIRLLSVHRFFEASILQYLEITKGENVDPADRKKSDMAAAARLGYSLILDDRYNVWKYQLHTELLPHSQQRYIKWYGTRNFGRSKPKMLPAQATARLYRESSREEAEFQASKRAESEKKEGCGARHEETPSAVPESR